MRVFLAALLVTLATIAGASAEWTIVDSANSEAAGRKVDVRSGNELVARFIYGEGQVKPFLHIYGAQGDCLTEWGAEQQFPHHRGLFIGWNKIGSELGTFDLWHMKGGQMNVTRLNKLGTTQDSATLVATIEWRGGKTDPSGSNLLLTETRTLVVSRPHPKRTQVDAAFALQPARDLTLGGDLQHAGVHFRGTKELVARKNLTSYLWEPDLPGRSGKVESPTLKYARLTFPVGERWYSATLLNAPANPVEQLSWRDYGRFGFFFARALKKEEPLTVHYRLLTEHEEKLTAKPTAEQIVESRARTQAEYNDFARPEA